MTHTIRPGFTAKFYSEPPSQTDPDGSLHWIARGANFVVVASRVVAGAQLPRAAADQADEYLVVLPQGMPATVHAQDRVQQSQGDSLFIVPPGDSRVCAGASGWMYRIFSKLAADWLPKAANAAAYAEGAADVAELVSWPEPEEGYRLRHYALADYIRPDNPMRLFRTRNLMVNIFPAGKGPRDVRKMTPHAHADFEQGSLALNGGWIHHMRYPWTPDMTSWRADEHEGINSPSLIVIPPKVIHTSQSLGDSGMRLVDVFAPPRDDFSLVPDLVNNAAEYPLPERLLETARPAAGKAVA